MLFNSYVFIFVFLPLSLFTYYFFLKLNKLNLAQLSLLLFSLFFYGWWNFYYLFLLIVSIIINYYIGNLLLYNKSKFYLTLGIILNLSLLFYYKYFNFFIDNFNLFFNKNFLFETIILPLGISFFTFQQISFLVESFSGSFREVRFIKYSIFVSFFPQLIAGPITRFNNFYPQLLSFNIKKLSRNLAIGLTIFSIGLFKKVCIADSISSYVDNGFSAVNYKIVLTFAESWITAILYTFQLYFDFSGYSDMAVGLAFMFGLIIPINFLSPFKSKNIAEFWRKWHISLSALARDYIFYPLALKLNQLCFDLSIKEKISNIITTIIPTIICFFAIGVWHGAGWNFIIFGLSHALLIVIYDFYSKFKNRDTKNSILKTIISTIFTFLLVVALFVFFRSENLTQSMDILSSMFGKNLISLPIFLEPQLNFLKDYGFKFSGLFYNNIFIFNNYFDNPLVWIIFLSGVSFFGINIYQVLNDDFKKYEQSKTKISWKPNLKWLSVTIILLFLSITKLSGDAKFLYFQF